MDVGVFTLLQVTECNVRSTRRFMVSLVKNPPARRSTSRQEVPYIKSLARRSTRLKTLPSIGLLARRATSLRSVPYVSPAARHTTRIKTVPSTEPPARRATRLIFRWKRVMPTPVQPKLLALPFETSTSYTSRGSTAGIIQPAQGLM